MRWQPDQYYATSERAETQPSEYAHNLEHMEVLLKFITSKINKVWRTWVLLYFEISLLQILVSSSSAGILRMMNIGRELVEILNQHHEIFKILQVKKKMVFRTKLKLVEDSDYGNRNFLIWKRSWCLEKPEVESIRKLLSLFHNS